MKNSRSKMKNYQITIRLTKSNPTFEADTMGEVLKYLTKMYSHNSIEDIKGYYIIKRDGKPF